jgi:predicted ABC-class ATPase
MPHAHDLRQTLARLDGKGYKAYKDIQGAYEFDTFTLFIDHVQGDPFAAPSKVRLRVPQRVANLPEPLFNTATRRVALQDFLGRCVEQAIYQTVQGRRGMGKSGVVAIDAGRQEVLQRTAVVLTPRWVEARLHVGLPASGRTILGRQAEEILCGELPRIVERSLRWHNLPQEEGEEFVACIENQEFMRAQLEKRGLVAFIANGSILPRESGASTRPLPRGAAVPFQSPESLQVTLAVANPVPGHAEPDASITGMGIPRGVTVIVGGGYHGKSTLLQALEHSVYPHIPGDGREYVITSRSAVKIRAEDGRRVEQVNISPFISNLPYGRSTTAFSTDDASGSTSQATSIVEALEVGAKVLLLDEDTSATNFMVRDARMQALVQKAHEPITPFLDRVRELYDTMGVSTVLVMGGSGDYFDVADTVIMMRDYHPHDVTAEARDIARSYPTRRSAENATPLDKITRRTPLPESFDPSRGRREVKIDARAVDLILFGSDAIDLRGIEQMVDLSQTRAIGYAIHMATEKFMDGRATLSEVVDMVEQFFDQHGLDALDPFHRKEHHPGNFARPRRYEIAAAINRLRTLQIRQRPDDPSTNAKEHR